MKVHIRFNIAVLTELISQNGGEIHYSFEKGSSSGVSVKVGDMPMTRIISDISSSGDLGVMTNGTLDMRLFSSFVEKTNPRWSLKDRVFTVYTERCREQFHVAITSAQELGSDVTGVIEEFPVVANTSVAA